MTPAEVCRAIYAAGMTVRADGADLVLKPADRLTPALRELLVTHKPELIRFLHAANLTTVELIEAAMLACDHHKDSEAARDQMRLDCANVPPHHRADYRDHFRRSYPDR